MANIPITIVQINIINATKKAKITDRYVDEFGHLWVGTVFNTLVIPLTADQIPSNTNPDSVEARLEALEDLGAGHIFVGNSLGKTQERAMTGDNSIDDVGSTSFASSGVAKIRNSIYLLG